VADQSEIDPDLYKTTVEDSLDLSQMTALNQSMAAQNETMQIESNKREDWWQHRHVRQNEKIQSLRYQVSHL